MSNPGYEDVSAWVERDVMTDVPHLQVRDRDGGLLRFSVVGRTEHELQFFLDRYAPRVLHGDPHANVNNSSFASAP